MADIPFPHEYIDTVTMAAMRAQGAGDQFITRMMASDPERWATMRAGTYNVVRGLQALGWTLIPPSPNARR